MNLSLSFKSTPSKEANASCWPRTCLPNTIGGPTGVASGPPSSPPTEAPSTVSMSSSKPGLSAASIGVGAGTAVDCWGKPTSKLHVSTRCPPRSWRRNCPAPSFSHVFFSSRHLVGRHLHQGNQPLSCRKLNFPDRLVLLQPLHCAPSHR